MLKNSNQKPKKMDDADEAECRVCAELSEQSETETGALVRYLEKAKRHASSGAAHTFWTPFWTDYADRVRRDPSERITIEFGGCGLKGYWACGFAHVWEWDRLPFLQYDGASMGACIAAFVVCRVSTVAWIRSYYELHALTIHGGMCLSDAVHIVLSRTLPDDAHVQCTGRLGIWVTHVPTMSDKRVGDFASKADLVRWLCTSCHSMYTAHTPTRGAYMDGMVLRYGDHAVESPTLFIAIHDVPTDVCAFSASAPVARLIRRGAKDAIRLLRSPTKRIFRWLPASNPARSLRSYFDVVCYWAKWAATRRDAPQKESNN
jgi:hypothetical protein